MKGLEVLVAKEQKIIFFNRCLTFLRIYAKKNRLFKLHFLKCKDRFHEKQMCLKKSKLPFLLISIIIKIFSTFPVSLMR